MMDFSQLAALPLFDNSLLAWSLAGAIALATLLVLLVVRRWIRGYHRKVLATAEAEFLEIPVQVLNRTTTA